MMIGIVVELTEQDEVGVSQSGLEAGRGSPLVDRGSLRLPHQMVLGARFGHPSISAYHLQKNNQDVLPSLREKRASLPSASRLL